MAPSDTRHRLRMSAGLLAAASAVVAIGATFLAWITTPMVTGGTTKISGWGTIFGGDELVDGINLNTLMEGEGSYRPALPIVSAAAIAVLAGFIISATRAGARPSRFVAGILAGCGAVLAGWSGWKVIDPGDAAGVLPVGEAAVGLGPVVSLFAGLFVLAIAIFTLAGSLDPSRPD